MVHSIENQKVKIENYLKNHPAATEYEFLFECCRASFAGTSVRYPENIRTKVFLDIVQHHKLIPQLYPILKNHCENLSNDVLQELYGILKRHNLHILKLAGELAQLSKLFDEQHIPWLSIKGPALALQLYGNTAARQAHDLDILVEENSLEKATNILIQAGYIPTYDPAGFNPTQIRYWRKYYKDAFFTHPTRNIYVELHWRIVTNKQIFRNIDFLKDHQIVTVGTHDIPVLNEITNALYLCYHGGYHAWQRLFWLWDMAQIIQNASSEKINIINVQANQWGLDKILGQTAYLSHIIFGIEIPDLLKKIPISPKTTKMVFRFILDQQISGLYQLFRNIVYHRRILPPQGLKSGLAVILTNPIHWKTIQLPERLFFLYYFLRPIIVVLRKIRKK